MASNLTTGFTQGLGFSEMPAFDAFGSPQERLATYLGRYAGQQVASRSPWVGFGAGMYRTLKTPSSRTPPFEDVAAGAGLIPFERGRYHRSVMSQPSLAELLTQLASRVATVMAFF